MRTIFFWNDGCWCEEDELEDMLYKQTQPTEVSVSAEDTDVDIDELVRSEIV